MANQNRGGSGQGQGGGQTRANGGMVQAAREGVQDLGQRVQEGASQVGERLSDGYDAAREGLAHGYRRAEGMVARNPGSSVMVGFGVGFGLGVLLTVLLSRREEDSWYERYVPDRLRNMHLPESIARHMPGH